MAIFVKSKDKQDLLNKINAAIKSLMVPWSVDSEGDYTMNDEKFKDCFWLHPYLNPDLEEYNLVFGMLGNSTQITTTRMYSLAHANFVEMLLDNFDEDIEFIRISSLGSNYDSLTSKNDKNE